MKKNLFSKIETSEIHFRKIEIRETDFLKIIIQKIDFGKFEISDIRFQYVFIKKSVSEKFQFEKFISKKLVAEIRF